MQGGKNIGIISCDNTECACFRISSSGSSQRRSHQINTQTSVLVSTLWKASARTKPPHQKKQFQSSLLPEGWKSVNFEHEILILKQKNKHSWQHKQTLFSFTEFPNLHGNQPFHYSTETFTHVLNGDSSCCTIHLLAICSKKNHKSGDYQTWTHHNGSSGSAHRNLLLKFATFDANDVILWTCQM